MSTIRGSGQAISKAERCSKYEIALILTRIDIKGKLWKWEKVINFSWDKNSEFSKLFRMMELQNRESENVIDEIVKICNEATICYAIEYSKSAMEIVYATRIYKDGFQTKIRDLQFSIDVQKKIDIYIESLSQNQKEIINIPEVQQLSPTLKNQNDKKVINIDQLEEILLEFVNRNSIQSNQDNKEKLDKIRNAIFYGCFTIEEIKSVMVMSNELNQINDYIDKSLKSKEDNMGNEYQGSLWAISRAERTGTDSLMIVLTIVTKGGELKTCEIELFYGSDDYRQFFRSDSIDDVIIRVENETLNYRIKFENRKIVSVEKSLKSFQFKQRVVLSFDTLNKINFYKQSIQNEVKNVRDDLNIVISPILRTYNDDKNEKLENKEDQIKKNNYTDIICECKRHESKKYLIKGEVDFMKQNFRKYENHMICNECIHKMHYDGLSINRFLEIHASL